MKTFKSHKFTFLLIAGFAMLLTIGCGKDKGGAQTLIPPAVIGPNNNNYQINYTWVGKIQVLDKSMFKRFLQDHDVCDFHGTIWTFGTWNCDNYDPLWVSIHLNSKTVPTKGYTQIFINYDSWATLPAALPILASRIDGDFLPIDQNTGVELLRRGNDWTYTYDAIFRYRIYGNLKKDNNLNIEVYYRGVKFGIATIAPYKY